MNRREQVIVELLERYDDLVATLNSRAGVPGDDGPAGLMPRSYTDSVRELERLMCRMRDEARPLWWHVSERYIRSRTVIRYELRPKLDKHNRVKRVKGKVVKEPMPRVQVVYDARVESGMVERGVRWLAERWALPHEPELTRDFLATG